jgi:hypothetical protein
LKLREGVPREDVARSVYASGTCTLRKSRELVDAIASEGFLCRLRPREKTGSAENPITKLFPATVTEERFVELLDAFCSSMQATTYTDDRDSRGLTDFTIIEDGLKLPINVKNAGTRFEKAKELVGIDPNDCFPIPAYKAFSAVEAEPNLVYVVSIDYDLVNELGSLLPALFGDEERITWDILNRYAGARLRDGEDQFVFSIVKKYWSRIKAVVADEPYQVISARKAIRILHKEPRRTPGIGLRAWGTGASAEVNVHICASTETTPWDSITERISREGLAGILGAINRKSIEEVYDPEI